jgi:hypothetical protein
MRTVLLAVLLLAGCTAGPGASPPPTVEATTVPTARPTASPTAEPTTTSAPDAVYTAEDEEIATLIKTSADQVIPQLKLLNEMDPSKLEDLFLPLDVWITSQKAAVEAHTPSACTTTAVDMFLKGMNQYDDIRKKFLAWRDWGAHGHAFPVAAPGQAVLTFERAVVELGPHCPS